MKLIPIVVAAALVFPVAASAQSLTDTHELVWHPSGKTPSMTYRLRDKPKCDMRFDNPRADKAQSKRCAAPAKAPTTSNASQ